MQRIGCAQQPRDTFRQPVRDLIHLAPGMDHAVDIQINPKSIAAGSVTASEVLRSAIEAGDSPACRHAFIRRFDATARTTAQLVDRAREAGLTLPALAGMPVSVKDLFDVAAQPTTAGSRALATAAPATRDSTAVARLRAAGAVLVGHTNMSEFAFSGVGINPHHGTPLNPRVPEQPSIPGGSTSGGAVSVATGAAWAALGSDTGGSIRIPSAFCGVTGIKPTFGRASKHGVVPLAYSLDHVGPMARGVADAALMLQAISGYDPRDRCTADQPVPDFSATLHDGVRGLVLGVPSNQYFDNVDPEVETAVRQAISRLEREGAVIEEVALPSLTYAVAAWWAICLVEASSVHQRSLRASPDLYNPDVRLSLELGELVPGTIYLKAQRARGLIKQDFRRAFEEHGLAALLAPTMPGTAPRHDQETGDVGSEEPAESAIDQLSFPANLSGLPALSVPCGFSAAGLPIGLQIIGRPFDEATVLRIGRTYEAVTDWTSRHPAL
jgi:aspartyl-tRNA(Asn)/glutamyl-tRNA(Gln) amidotransferase subunit A